MQANFFLRPTIIVGEGFFRLTTISQFPSLPFLICFWQLVGVLRHNLFLCPFVTFFRFCSFGLDLGLLSLFFLSPLITLLGVLFNGAHKGFIIFEPLKGYTFSIRCQKDYS
jgi:hypothetical protein